METILLKVKTQGIDYVNNFVFDNGLEGRLGFDFTDCGVDDYEKFAYIRLEDETLIKYSLGTGVRTNIPVRTEFTRSEIIQITPAAEKVVGGKRETHTFGLFTIDTQQVIGSITELDPANIDIIERLLKEFKELLESFGLVESDVVYILERLDNFIQSGKTVEQWVLDFKNYLELKFEDYYDRVEIDDKVNYIFGTMNNLITDVYINMGNHISEIYDNMFNNSQQINNRLSTFEQEEYYPFKASVYTKDEVYTKYEVYTKDETDGFLDDKADSSDTYSRNEVYTKDETEGFLDLKANKDDVYTKSETYTKDEVNANTYTKSETDGLLDFKADKNTIYTKTEVDGLLDDKASESKTYTDTMVGDIESLMEAIINGN